MLMLIKLSFLAKCIQRKNPCTYVKFQRQTAPSGPGHRHNIYDSSLSSAVPRPDELFLGPPPMTVPSMGQTIPGATELFYPSNAPFAFHPGAHSWDSDSPNPSPSPSLSLSASAYATDHGQDSPSPDLAARYRSASFSGQPTFSNLIGTNVNDLYALQQRAHAQPGAGLNDAWQMPSEFRIPPYQQRKIDESFAQYLPSSLSNSALSNTFDPNSSSNGLYNLGNNSLHARRGSVGAYSDSNSNSNSSAPNSAASSSIHLPLEFSGESGPSPSEMMFSYDDGQHPPPSRDGSRVTSSFGLMSLADGANQSGHPGDQPFSLASVNFGDLNVNGGQTDASGAPFFSQHAMKMPPQDSTPRPFLNMGSNANGGPTLSLNSPRDRDRETEMRELRDFWKQYLRTPLTGPQLGQTPKAELLNSQVANMDYGLGVGLSSIGASTNLGGLGRPTPKRGLSRVASLPSVRTPSVETFSYLTQRARDANNGADPSQHNGYGQSHQDAGGLQQSLSSADLAHANSIGPGAGDGLGTDNLKSYEQAILARKPFNLNFTVPPRKGRNGSASSSVSPQPAPQSILQSQVQPGRGPLAALAMENLANPLDSGSSSEESGLKGSNARALSSAAARPGFKRLASQTLERGSQKRTNFRFGSGEDEDGEDFIEERDSEMESESEAGMDERETRMRMPYGTKFGGKQADGSPSPMMDFMDSSSASTRKGDLSPGSYHRGLAMAHAQAQSHTSLASLSGRGADGRSSSSKEDTVQNGLAGETLMERFRRQSAPAVGAVKPGSLTSVEAAG